MIIESDINNEEMDDDEICPLAESAVDEIISAVLFPRPFGINWGVPRVIDFLKKCGYKIIDGAFAVKPGEDVPEDPNIPEAFDNEVQKILMEWLLSLRKNTKD